MRSFGKCESVTVNPLIPVKAKHCCITFQNPNRTKVRYIKIDDCVITKGLRCDWLLINEKHHEHYVELKGSDVRHAFEQIEETIKQVGENTDQRKAWVISTRSPLLSPEIQKQQLIFRKKYKVAVLVKNINHTADI